MGGKTNLEKYSGIANSVGTWVRKMELGICLNNQGSQVTTIA